MAQLDMPLSDLSLDELRLALAPAMAEAAAFDGWTPAAIDAAAERLGVSRDVARLAFPGRNPAMAMIAAWVAHVDAEMAQALPESVLAEISIRQRIRRLISFRLDAVAPTEEALRRALAIMAMPQNVARSLKLGWHSADAMWRLAGDTATDLNFIPNARRWRRSMPRRCWPSSMTAARARRRLRRSSTGGSTG